MIYELGAIELQRTLVVCKYTQRIHKYQSNLCFFFFQPAAKVIKGEIKPSPDPLHNLRARIKAADKQRVSGKFVIEKGELQKMINGMYF